jgi:hypothetical protein
LGKKTDPVFSRKNGAAFGTYLRAGGAATRCLALDQSATAEKHMHIIHPREHRRLPARSEQITGRDWYLIRQGLTTTYALIGTLPERCQEAANRHDMGRLVAAAYGENWLRWTQHFRHVINEAEWLNGKQPLVPDLLAPTAG